MNFDLIVIGSGPGGYKAALTAAHLGAKVALVEKALPGGTCLNQGCIPKKTLLHLATLIEDVNNLQDRGLVGRVRGDFNTAIAHKNAVVAGIRDNFSIWLRRLGVQVFAAEARLLGGQRVELRSCPNDATPARVLQAGRIILAAGSAPLQLATCPTDGERILNSRDFMMNLSQLPESVLCIGGGAVGVELGFLLHQFGSRVCIVEQHSRLLDRPRIPERASAMLERKFARIGIEVHKNASMADYAVAHDGIKVNLSDGFSGTFEKILVAVGRKPQIDGLGLREAGVAVNADGFVQVSEYLETSAAGIYAIGDLKPGPMTANAALHDAKIAAGNAINGNQMRANYHKVPVVIDSALEIAAVGLTEDLAEAAGFDADVAMSSLGGSGKARARHDFEGFIEVVHDAETGQLLGGCIVGPEAGEQIHMLAAACQSARGLWFLRDMSYSHPSWCEELEAAVDPYAAELGRSHKTIFTPGIFAGHR
ncbi:MAG: NAD(P)/FAD-dependent oxidoreductase [Burkholderiales bacterium]|nr:NAD(P)/FAD-dependent oxidoreductase [Burkholderiales bacterium]